MSMKQTSLDRRGPRSAAAPGRLVIAETINQAALKPARTSVGAATKFSQSADWNYSAGIKIFYHGPGEPPPLTGTGFIPMPSELPLAGHVCQAARSLLDVTQAWLWQEAKVSRKTINDFENGYSAPKAALVLRLRRALEAAGAQFIYGENVVGVVVYRSRETGSTEN